MIADRFTVLLDANVLHPYEVRDALLRFCEAGLFRARWSEDIVEEWTRSVLRRRPELSGSLDRQVEAMREAFPEAWVEGYWPLVQRLDLPDPDDRHILAAAIKAGAQHIVTENLRDFPVDILAEFDIEPVTADAFLCSTFELYPGDACDAIRAMRLAYRGPPSIDEFLLRLTRQGLVRLAALAQPYRQSL